MIVLCLFYQFVIFKPLSYCLEETIGFDVKATFASRSVSRLIRWYNKPGGITKEFWEKAIQFHGTFHGLKITNWYHGTIKRAKIKCKKFFYKSLFNLAYLWRRAWLVINMKQKYFSLPVHQPAENLIFVYDFYETLNKG